ncbi:dienelactone hydrolase family protein [candidate division KSB1 bacterium]|nr:dienelactone hydrolase family protein [candidate division KSB1 bacterium]
MDTKTNPHQNQPVIQSGASLKDAKAAMILLHGRGADAQDILTLAPELDQPDFAYLAPNANGNTWYPQSFMAPVSQNEPGISSGLQTIADVLAQLSQAGFPPEKVMLLGFSQGACLSLEFIARNARRYGGVAGLSGGLIGPEGTPRNYNGSLAGTPVFLGCSDVDFHVPKERVSETAKILQELGGEVTERLYPNMEHTINQDEIDVVQGMMSSVLNSV